MKKFITLFLVISLVLSSLIMVSCSKAEGNKPVENDTTTEATDAADQTENADEGEKEGPAEIDYDALYPDTDGIAPGAPGSSSPYRRTKLTLNSNPVWENGVLTLTFNEEYMFEMDKKAYIGIFKGYSADTIPGEIDFDAMEDMVAGEGVNGSSETVNIYKGVVINALGDIDPAEYEVFITFDMYEVDSFMLVID